MTENITPVCYHCGQPVTVVYQVRVDNQDRLMCCRGCQAVAQAIIDNGLVEYYRSRTALPASAHEILPDDIRKLALYDNPDVQRSFVIETGVNHKEAVLILEGITCAACVWLNERHLKQLAGVVSAEVNYASHRVRVSWDEQTIGLSRILQEIQQLGYNAHPYNAQRADHLRKVQRKKDLQRIAIAGIAASQVMMLAVALYAGAWYGIDINMVHLLRWFSLLLTIPVVSYAAWPFYRAAWSGLRSRHLNMDVPVALAILSAFIGSVWATMTGGAHVYYDTIGMFTLFLLASRLLETGAREKSIEAAENLLKLQPAMAIRLHDGQQEYVPVTDLLVGDCILTKAGEVIAADSKVIGGMSSVDESLLTGESRAVTKQVGDHVIAGSVNLEAPMTLEVRGVGENTVLAGIVRLVDKAQSEKPKIAQLADRVAVWFTLVLLLFALLVGLLWLWLDPARTFEIILAILVVTCPCALSLAVPAATAAAGSHLIKRGILVMRGHALETLAQVDHVVFDKTGTLTLGQPRIVAIIRLAQLPEAKCSEIAASLEQVSEHPLARAFEQHIAGKPLQPVFEATNMPGQGITGIIQGQTYRLGNRQFSGLVTAQEEERILALHPGTTLVWLSGAAELLAVFVLTDQLRANAVQAIDALRQLGMQVSILSGDGATAVAHIATQLGIDDYHGLQQPQDKLQFLQSLQAQGRTVAMVGDGVNDAPVLAGAQVSFAMGTGTDVASQSSDIVLLSCKLEDVAIAIETGKATVRIMHQNLGWAVIYNLTALPFAALGYISPWVAALGMSISSLIVVLNALRLR